MYREEFLAAVSGFDTAPIRLRTSEGWTGQLYFDAAYYDAVRFLADERPLVIRYSEILEMRFDTAGQAGAEAGFRSLLGDHAAEQFRVQAEGVWSPLLRYVSEQRGFLIADAAGKPYLVRCDAVSAVSFDAELPAAPAAPAAAAAPVSAAQSYSALRDAAHRYIKPGPWIQTDRRDEIRERVKGTPLENPWARIDDMVRNALKANAINEKADRIITELDDLFRDYECVEVKIMLADLFAKAGDFDNASLEYEDAGDYENAAYYAHRCEERGYEYAFGVYGKWIIRDRGRSLPVSVYSNFLWLAQMLHKGRACAEILKPDLKTTDTGLQEVLFYGLLLVLNDYLTDDQLPAIEGLSRTEQIQVLHEALRSASADEEAQPLVPAKLKTIAQLSKGKSTALPVEPPVCTLTANGDDTYTGYIILFGYNLAFGFIANRPDAKRGIFFKVSELEPRLQAYRTELLTLKVTCRLITVVYNGKEQMNAAAVTAAEDLGAFFRRKGIAYHDPDEVQPEKPELPAVPADSTPCVLEKNPDGETCTGYIILMGYDYNYGFIAERPDAARVIFFRSADLEPALQEFRSRLVSLKVTCRVVPVRYDGKDQLNAVDIHPAEDLEVFLLHHGSAAEQAAAPAAAEEPSDALLSEPASASEAPLPDGEIPVISEETVPELPVAEETAPAEPVAEEAAPVEPVAEETAPAEPVAEETAPVEPVAEETAPVEPVAEETAPVEPAPTEPESEARADEAELPVSSDAEAAADEPAPADQPKPGEPSGGAAEAPADPE
jgi:hypothetical protein